MFLDNDTYGNFVYAAAIDLVDLNLTAGTYWITFSDGMSSDTLNSGVYWVESNGASDAFQKDGSNPADPIQSEAFRIVGVPESGTVSLCGIGAVIMFTALRRRQMNRRSA